MALASAAEHIAIEMAMIEVERSECMTPVCKITIAVSGGVQEYQFPPLNTVY